MIPVPSTRATSSPAGTVMVPGRSCSTHGGGRKSTARPRCGGRRTFSAIDRDHAWTASHVRWHVAQQLDEVSRRLDPPAGGLGLTRVQPHEDRLGCAADPCDARARRLRHGRTLPLSSASLARAFDTGWAVPRRLRPDAVAQRDEHGAADPADEAAGAFWGGDTPSPAQHGTSPL